MNSVAKTLFVSVLLSLTVGAAACSRISLPSLEDASCREARDNARKFYSLHFDRSLVPSAEDLKQKESFLTPELFAKLASRAETPEDYFTSTSDYPKAFRVGTCTAESNDKVRFDVRLFWRDDKRSEEREVVATMVRADGKWLIDEVAPKK